MQERKWVREKLRERKGDINARAMVGERKFERKKGRYIAKAKVSKRRR